MGNAKEIQAKRKLLKEKYKNLYDELLALLFRYDPIGINFKDNADEYSLEVETILPRLKEAHSPEKLCQIIHEEFVRWFGAETAGSASRYETLAKDVWGFCKNTKAKELVKDAIRLRYSGSTLFRRAYL